MITTERQYRITREQEEKFERAVAEIDGETEHLDPGLRKAMRESLESMLEELREQIQEYESLCNGEIDVIEVESFGRLPDALIQARIARGATQRELARRLGLREQQIQRYEVTRYEGASLRRMQAVAEALGVVIHGRVILAPREPREPVPPRGGRAFAGV